MSRRSTSAKRARKRRQNLARRFSSNWLSWPWVRHISRWPWNRLGDIHRLARKHHIAPEELYVFHQQLSDALSQLETSDNDLDALSEHANMLREQYREQAKHLSKARQKAATKLGKDVASPEALDTWWQQIDDWRAEREGKLYEPSKPGEALKSQEVVEALCRVTRGEAYVTTDVGQHQMFAAQYYKFEKPNRLITSGGLGTMGFGFPAAMGIKQNYPDADVVCVTGEGSFQMMMQELSTCKQYGIGVKIVNLNNASLGMVRQWQDLNYKSRHAHSYMESLPDFHLLIEAYGFTAITVNTLDELEDALERTFANKHELVFLDVKVDPHEHVYPMQVPLGSMRDMLLSKTERT